MASDFEEGVLDDVDAICGWGGADFDDELLGRGRRRASHQAPAKGGIKRKPEKVLASSSSGAALGKAQQQQQEMTGLSPDKRLRAVDGISEKKDRSPVLRKPKRRQPREIKEPQQQIIAKPSPRTTSILEENAAIAALGRQRRMKVVAAAMAANVPRKQGIASVVSASFEGGSDDEHTDSDSQRRRSDDLVPSSAPQNQQAKLPRVIEPSTAPARPIDPSKKVHPPLPLPLLSINPNAGGNETRLSGKDDTGSQGPRHWRRHRKQNNSLLPSRDASEHWESNFPPNLRRFRSPRKSQAELPDASKSVASSSFTRNVRVPLVPSVHDVTQRTKELLPMIHQTSKEFQHATVTDSVVRGDEADKSNLREVEREVEEEDESWTRCYDDPEALTKSMAGLIQALSTFAADGKHTRTSKPGKNRKRRAKLQQQAPQYVPVNPPSLSLPIGGEIKTTPGISTINEGQHETQASDRKRKHRKLRNKQSNSVSHHDQVP
ncbi:hypothetical protein PR003_g12060 [Phytophthora rubi]|uniref:Uncharacterized protein n=1 Tax=Phytophthora rubi TaxID=129364 RepID=A0A6A4FLE5_9STRA|nr:hypothetical protein PR003_g12060 [Phytophthora rubi]